MGQQEETTEQIHRKRRKISSSSSRSTLSIPFDVVSEILSKLPAKSLMRFRCVSKLWSSITTGPYFINAFETQSAKKRPCLLFCIKRRDNLLVFSLPQAHHHNSDEPYSVSSEPVDSYHMKLPKQNSFSTNESVHGLISCFPKAAAPIIWSPTMRKFLTLPKPEKRCNKSRKFFLGYDPVEGKHKVLCIPHGKSVDECQVLTLGSAQESWRRLKTNHSHHIIFGRHECINGVLYYEAYTNLTEYVNIIMSFDVRSEKFHMINLPWNTTHYCTRRFTPYQGRLACVTDNRAGGTTLWILKDAEKHDWSPKNFPAPFSYIFRSYFQSERRHFHFIGITDAGEFLYVPCGIHKPFYVLYLDLGRNRLHRVEYKGIADDEFRLKNEFGERPLDKIHTVLHKETLMSL